MLFCPKSSKFKKFQKGRLSNRIIQNINLKERKKNCIKLLSMEHGRITSKQFTAFRFLVKKNIKKRGLLNFVSFPQISVSKKPLEIRMGKGKGAFSHWSSKMKKGSVICYIFCKNQNKKKILRNTKKAQIRLPILTKVNY